MQNFIYDFSKIAHQYDCFIFDIWGVIHDGKNLFNDAVECLVNLSETMNKKIIMLSNSPKLKTSIICFLNELKFPNDINYNVMTSGDYAAEMMNKSLAVEQPCYFIGPPNHFCFKKSLNLKFTDSVEDAASIICSGFPEFNNCMLSFETILQKFVSKNAVFYCINPDRYALIGNSRVPCAGLLADQYRSMLGKVHYFGKPYLDIYHFLQKKFKILNEKIIIIGDSMQTDIQGAVRYGHDSMLVLNGIEQIGVGGINNEKNKLAAKKIINSFEFKPTFVTDKLRWKWQL